MFFEMINSDCVPVVCVQDDCKRWTTNAARMVEEIIFTKFLKRGIVNRRHAFGALIVSAMPCNKKLYTYFWKEEKQVMRRQIECRTTGQEHPLNAHKVALQSP